MKVKQTDVEQQLISVVCLLLDLLRKHSPPTPSWESWQYLVFGFICGQVSQAWPIRVLHTPDQGIWSGIHAWANLGQPESSSGLRADTGVWPAQSQRLCAQQVYRFGLVFCTCHFEILNNFTFELVFHKRSPMGQWPCTWAEEIQTSFST